MQIIEAKREDSPLIGEVVVSAIGEELAHGMAGKKDVKDVIDTFSRLAARDDSQYSYRNTLKAIDSDGKPMGFIIGYDGARLHELRHAFIEEAEELWGERLDETKIPDETDAEEYYLDSLAVFPQYRGKGVAKALIEAMSQRAQQTGKPLGLLCDKTNIRARKLYENLGFRQVGERYFAGELMDHLLMTSNGQERNIRI